MPAKIIHNVTSDTRIRKHRRKVQDAAREHALGYLPRNRSEVGVDVRLGHNNPPHTYGAAWATNYSCCYYGKRRNSGKDIKNEKDIVASFRSLARFGKRVATSRAHGLGASWEAPPPGTDGRRLNLLHHHLRITGR